MNSNSFATAGEKEQWRLNELKRLNILDSEPETKFDNLVAIAARIAEVPAAAISLIDQDRQWFKAKLGIAINETSRDVAFCNRTVQRETFMEVMDAQKSPFFFENPLVTGEPYIRYYAGFPLFLASGACVGSLCVLGDTPKKLTEQQREILEYVAQQVVSEIEAN